MKKRNRISRTTVAAVAILYWYSTVVVIVVQGFSHASFISQYPSSKGSRVVGKNNALVVLHPPQRRLQATTIEHSTAGKHGFMMNQNNNNNNHNNRDENENEKEVRSSNNSHGNDKHGVVGTVDDYDPLETANMIQPNTKRLRQSMMFFARFVIDRVTETRAKDKKRQLQKAMKKLGKTLDEDEMVETPPTKWQLWEEFNEQRRNVIALAGYTRQMITPSFTFLSLGAIMSSIVPHYYSECIQCISTVVMGGIDGRRQLTRAILGLAITSFCAALFTGLRGSLFWIGGCRANYNMRVKLHRSLLLQEAAFFDENETGYLLSRLNSDVNKVGQVISYHVNVVFRQSIEFLIGSIFLFRISPKLSLYAFGGISLLAYLSAIYGTFARDLAERVQNTFADGTAVAETSFTMSETIRAFDGVATESSKYEAAQSHALDLEEVQAWAYGSHKFVSDTVETLLYAMLLIVCYNFGTTGRLEAAKLTSFMFYSKFVLEASKEVGEQWAKIQSAIGASSSVFELIKRIPAVRDPSRKSKTNGSIEPSSHTAETDALRTAGATDISRTLNTTQLQSATTSLTKKSIAKKALVNGQSMLNGRHTNFIQKETQTSETTKSQTLEPLISMTNMTVTYGAMERPALSNVNLDIYPGDRIAIVGRSGSGKSSMLRSILRFYDPSSGSITLEGVDLRDMTRAETAAKIAIVQQEPRVFPMSLMENVLYGMDDQVDKDDRKTRKDVSECLRLAGLPVHPGNDLSLDLDSRIGEGGRALSGGQRQRVAIARAIIRSPDVLLLDEPTAALDSASEKKVVASLQQAMEHTRSMVMVTHRLGVIRALDVNRVVVLDKGEIVETGDPEELLQRDSLYASFAREQGIVAAECRDRPETA